MSLEKTYSRINWENYPSAETPINASNLNRMDLSLNAQDDRIITLDTTKLNVTDAYSMVKDVSFNEQNGVFTFTYYNGTTKTIDTAIEKIATNFSFNETTQQIVLTLLDGTTKNIDVSSFITTNEFLSSNNISFSVSKGKVKANLIKGSITEDYLEANYLANIKVQAQTSTNAMTTAQTYMENAYSYMNNAERFSQNANISENNALNASQNASQSAQAIVDVETSVNSSLSEITNIYDDIKFYKDVTERAENSAMTYYQKSSQLYASMNKLNKIAESWAIGNTGERQNEDYNNSKYFSIMSENYMNQAKISADKAESYSNIIAPDFYFDDEEMTLYIKVGTGVSFLIDDDNVLYWTISA